MQYQQATEPPQREEDYSSSYADGSGNADNSYGNTSSYDDSSYDPNNANGHAEEFNAGGGGAGYVDGNGEGTGGEVREVLEDEFGLGNYNSYEAAAGTPNEGNGNGNGHGQANGNNYQMEGYQQNYEEGYPPMQPQSYDQQQVNYEEQQNYDQQQQYGQQLHLYEQPYEYDQQQQQYEPLQSINNDDGGTQQIDLDQEQQSFFPPPPPPPTVQRRKSSTVSTLPPQQKIRRKESLKEILDVINSPSLNRVDTISILGNPQEPGGLFSIVPVRTDLSASFVFTLTSEDLLMEEGGGKVVSIPFGPAEWSWQLVVYPNGTSPDSPTHLSAYVRTVKSDQEKANEGWTRPVGGFWIRVLAESIDGDGEGEVRMDSEEEFQAFHETRQGWGFNDFLPLPLSPSLLTSTGSLRLEVNVQGPIHTKCSTMTFEELVSLSRVMEGGETTTSSFGPPSCSWCVQFKGGEGKEEYPTSLACYLLPIHSDFEREIGEEDWERVITTFSIRIFNPQTKAVIASKCLTGSFFFNGGNARAGWPDLLPISGISQDGGEVLVRVQVTWDPALLNENSEKGRWKRLQTQASRREGEVRQLRQGVLSLEAQLVKQDLVEEEVTELREKVRRYEAELGKMREWEKGYNISQVHLNTVRERLANFRLRLETDSFDDPPRANKLGNDLLIKDLKYQLALSNSEKATLSLSLSQLQSELLFVTRSQTDAALLSPIPTYEQRLANVNPLAKISYALTSGRNEVVVCRAALEELQTKFQSLPVDTLSQGARAGLIADMSVLQIGLDIAFASLWEVRDYVYENLPEVEVGEFEGVLREVEEVRGVFLRGRIGLENGNFGISGGGQFEKDQNQYQYPPQIGQHSLQNFVYPPEEGGNFIQVMPNNDSVQSPTEYSNNVIPPPIIPSVIVPHTHKGKRSSAAQFNELEQANDLKVLSSKVEAMFDVLKNRANGAAGTFGGVITRAFDIADIPPWTPKERETSPLDAATLQLLLKTVQRDQKRRSNPLSFLLPSLGNLLVIMLAMFALYSTVFFVCNDQVQGFEEFQPFCESVVMPSYTQGHALWHSTSERVMLDILPTYTTLAVSKARQLQKTSRDVVRETIKRAFKQGNDFVAFPQLKVEAIHPIDHDAPKTEPIFHSPIADPTTLEEGMRESTGLEGKTTASEYVSSTRIASNPVLEDLVFTEAIQQEPEIIVGIHSLTESVLATDEAEMLKMEEITSSTIFEKPTLVEKDYPPHITPPIAASFSGSPSLSAITSSSYPSVSVSVISEEPPASSTLSRVTIESLPSQKSRLSTSDIVLATPISISNPEFSSTESLTKSVPIEILSNSIETSTTSILSQESPLKTLEVTELLQEIIEPVSSTARILTSEGASYVEASPLSLEVTSTSTSTPLPSPSPLPLSSPSGTESSYSPEAELEAEAIELIPISESTTMAVTESIKSFTSVTSSSTETIISSSSIILPVGHEEIVSVGKEEVNEPIVEESLLTPLIYDHNATDIVSASLMEKAFATEIIKSENQESGVTATSSELYIPEEIVSAPRPTSSSVGETVPFLQHTSTSDGDEETKGFHLNQSSSTEPAATEAAIPYHSEAGLPSETDSSPRAEPDDVMPERLILK